MLWQLCKFHITKAYQQVMLCKFEMIDDIQVSSHMHPSTQWLLYKNAAISGKGSGYAKQD